VCQRNDDNKLLKLTFTTQGNLEMLTPAQRQLLAERQATRLHIEAMKSTRDELRRRAKFHKNDSMSYQTAHKAVLKMADKIARVSQELAFLEEKWKF
jgi:hypothetical protein